MSTKACFQSCTQTILLIQLGVARTDCGPPGESKFSELDDDGNAYENEFEIAIATD